jgi:glycerophosphoryl diester phosphodiesterase
MVATGAVEDSMDRRTVITGLVLSPIAAVTAVPTQVQAAARPAAPAGISARRSRPGQAGTLVIGHRGASGYRPEHTLASYELAARLGADFMEPDVVTTKDGVLVCRHEPEIGGTTNVASHPEFASRRVTKQLDGVAVTGWWAEDFTLAELNTLRAIERLPAVRQENTLYDERFHIPTLQQVLDLRADLSRKLGREIGVYPETKHPTYFQHAGLPLESRLLGLLRRNGLNQADAPVIVQSFETTNLKQLRRFGLRTRVVQLLGATGAPFDLVNAGDSRTYADLATPDGLRAIARYGDGIGPDKSLVIPRQADGSLGRPSTLVEDAHRSGLIVHPYTFRAENTFLPVDLRRGTSDSDFGRAIDEQVAFLRAGIDGLFTDQPDIGVISRADAATAA